MFIIILLYPKQYVGLHSSDEDDVDDADAASYSRTLRVHRRRRSRAVAVSASGDVVVVGDVSVGPAGNGFSAVRAAGVTR